MAIRCVSQIFRRSAPVLKSSEHCILSANAVLGGCSVTDAIYRRKVKFLTNLLQSGNIIYAVFVDIINRQLAALVSNVT